MSRSPTMPATYPATLSERVALPHRAVNDAIKAVVKHAAITTINAASINEVKAPPTKYFS